MKELIPLNFRDADHRDKWIADNADYFTVIQRKNRQNLRTEKPTLAEAIAEAKAILAREPDARLVLYAVWGQMSAYVNADLKR